MSIDHGCHGVLSVACILRTLVDIACTVTWSAFVNVPKPVYPTDARLVHGWVATAAGLSSRTNRCIFDRPLVVVAVTLVCCWLLLWSFGVVAGPSKRVG